MATAATGAKPKRAGRSPVWDLITLNPEDKSKWVCNKCGTIGSRGHDTDTSRMGTSLATNHVKKCNADGWEAAVKKRELEDREKQEKLKKSSVSTYFPSDPAAKKRKLSALSSCSQNQPTIKESFSMKTPWPVGSKEHLSLSLDLIEMLLKDKQPLYTVEREGFSAFFSKYFPRYKMMSSHYYNDNILTRIHSKSIENIRKMLNEVRFVSFDTDIWQNLAKNQFISLVAHCVFSDFKQQYVVLNSFPFPDSHTGVRIGEMISSGIREWGIPSYKVHAIVHDNASNMNLGIDELSGYEGLRCFVHTTQLVIKDGVLQQVSVKNVLTKCRKFYSYFHQSAARTTLFKKMQAEQLGKSINNCLTVYIDNDTRWDSIYKMLKRIVDLKPVIVNFITEYTVEGANFTGEDWRLLIKLEALLKKFTEITEKYSDRYKGLCSDIIPDIMRISKKINNWLAGEELKGLKSTLKNFKDSIAKRYEHYLENRICILATYLDPRYKLSVFQSATEGSAQHHIAIKAALVESYLNYDLEKTQHEAHLEDLPQTSDSVDNLEHPENSRDDTVLGPEKSLSSTDEFPDFVIPRNIDHVADSKKESAIKYAIEEEVANYNAMPKITNSLPHTWWAENRDNFPYISELARKFLSLPATSIESERFFSLGGQIHAKSRTR